MGIQKVGAILQCWSQPGGVFAKTQAEPGVPQTRGFE